MSSLHVRSLLPHALLLSLVFLLVPATATGQEPDDPDDPDAPAEVEAPEPGEADDEQEAEEKDDGYQDFGELVEGAETHEGYLDLYVKEGKLYLAVPPARMDEQFLVETEIARGIGARGLFGGTMLDIFEGRIVSLERHGERVYLKQHPHRFTAADAATERAVELSFSPSVVASAKIASIREDSALVVDATGWFVSDLSGVGERVRRAVGENGRPGSARLAEKLSYLEAVEAFPENVNVRATLTFRPDNPTGISSVPDSRYLPVSVHYTMARLPERPMTPRVGDDRVGYFLTVLKNFSDDEDGTFFDRYVNRWRLEAEGPADGDGLRMPVEPIVYHLDRNIPEAYRPYVEQGIEAWNEAFEAAGWRDAIRAEPLPEGASAEDVRYATVRWNTSDEPGYGAIGPSVVDPRTGEILDADILVEASMVLGFRQSWRTLVDPATALRQTLSASPTELRSLARGGEASSLGAELAAQGSLLRGLLLARGEVAPGEPVPEAYVGEALRWVIMHEVGHTLGLRHNFRSSTDTPLEKLHDAEWARERGVFSSVMEYPTVNVAADGGETPHHYNPGIGSYDRWAIGYGYTPDADRASELARQAARPGHAYGTDEDARGPGALDPTVNVYDLGADPLAWAEGRADLLERLWAEVPTEVLEDDAPYSDATDALNTLLAQYARALAPAVKYVGGQYQHRDHVGDRDGRPPFANVDRERQLRALEFLIRRGLSESAFRVPDDVLKKLGADRWSHWGHSNTFDGRIDFPLRERVLGVQAVIVEELTDPFRMARIRDAEVKYGDSRVLTIPEVMERLTDAVWSEVLEGDPRPVTGQRRDLQRVHLERMTELLLDAGDRMPADARSVARAELERLVGAIDGAFEASEADQVDRFRPYTRAHLAESRALAVRALDAGLEAQLPGR